MITIKLEEVFHKGNARIRINAPYCETLNEMLRHVKYSRYSATLRNWHIEFCPNVLNEFLLSCVDKYKIHDQSIKLYKANLVSGTKTDHVDLIFIDHPKIELIRAINLQFGIKENVDKNHFRINIKLKDINLLANLLKQNMVLVNHVSEYHNITSSKQTATINEHSLVLSKDQLLQLINNQNHLANKVLLSIMYACGLRIDEIINLEIEHINFEQELVSIVKDNPSFNRSIPLGKTLNCLIREYLTCSKSKTYLFETTTNHRLNTENVIEIFKSSLLKANIDQKLNIQILRNSYAQHLLEDNYSLEDIKNLLGHNSISTTKNFLKHLRSHPTEINSDNLQFLNENIHKV